MYLKSKNSPNFFATAYHYGTLDTNQSQHRQASGNEIPQLDSFVGASSSKSSPQTAWAFSWESHFKWILWLSIFTMIRHFWAFSCVLFWCTIWFSIPSGYPTWFRGIAGLGSQGKLPNTSRVENCYIQAHSDVCGLDKIAKASGLCTMFYVLGCCFSTLFQENANYWHSSSITSTRWRSLEVVDQTSQCDDLKATWKI